MKICITFARGGHFDELKMILDAFKDYDYFFVTTLAETTMDLPNIKKTYFIKKISKDYPNRIVFLAVLTIYYIYLLLPCFRIIIKERPDIIIGLGGEATLHLIYMGKIINKSKILYIESLARVRSLSGTGKLVYRIADLFIVQSKYLSEKYNKAKYWGRLL